MLLNSHPIVANVQPPLVKTKHLSYKTYYSGIVLPHQAYHINKYMYALAA